MLKKRIHENLLENNRDKIQKVEKPVARRILISSKNKKPEKSTLSLDTMMSKAECSQKLNRVPKCPSMLIDDYVDLHKSKEMDATKSNNGEKPGSSVNRSSNQNQSKKGTRQESVQNRAKVNEEDAITNREEEKEVLWSNEELCGDVRSNLTCRKFFKLNKCSFTTTSNNIQEIIK
ncbi:hypothetical protein RYX36_017599 [Vicia faba]